MQTIYILILFAHVGTTGYGNSNAITTAEFSSQITCIQAGDAAKRLVQGATKKIEYTCVKK